MRSKFSEKERPRRHVSKWHGQSFLNQDFDDQYLEEEESLKQDLRRRHTGRGLDYETDDEDYGFRDFSTFG